MRRNYRIPDRGDLRVSDSGAGRPAPRTLGFTGQLSEWERISVGKIVTVEYVDDLEGTSIDAESVDTVEFSYRGQDYTLVLTKKNGAQFDKDVSRYITAAKKAQSRDARAARKPAKPRPRQAAAPKPAVQRKTSPRKKAVAAASGPERTRAIRQWAADNGHTVSTRGRISVAVLQAFDAAH
jgi:hypothetical protein